MSTEPTPENLANALRRWAEVEQGYPLHSRTGVELAAKAADLIEAQQARIEELEGIIAELWEDAASPYVRGLWAESVHDWDASALTLADVLARHDYGEVDEDGHDLLDVDVLLAACPDTPETRPTPDPEEGR